MTNTSQLNQPISDEFLKSCAEAFNRGDIKAAEGLCAEAEAQARLMKKRKHDTSEILNQPSFTLNLPEYAKRWEKLSAVREQHNHAKEWLNRARYGLWALQEMKKAADNKTNITVPTRADYVTSLSQTSAPMEQALTMARIG